MIVDSNGEQIAEHTQSDAAIEAQIRAALSRRQLEFYKPYPKQIDFHRTGSIKLIRERLLMAGNQLGKCCTISSYIDHPDGTRSTFGELYKKGDPFPVLSWNGSRVIETQAVTPIRKPVEPCVRLWFSDGRWIECALRHRVLTSSGEYVFCDSLLASLPTLRASSSELDQPARVEGALRWFQTPRGFLVGCLDYCRLYDARLHRASGIAREWIQRQCGVPEYSFASSASGESSSRYTNTRQSGFGHQSNLDAEALPSGRCAGFLDRVVRRFARYTRRCIQALQRTLLASILPLQSSVSISRDQSSQAASVTPFSIDGNRIVAYESITSQEVYDFTVPETQNYIACGIVHHNTMSAGAEVAMHATGLYPDWWPGRRFPEPIGCWVGGPTSQMTRDNPQRILMGEIGAWGTGMIPSSKILEIKKAVHGVADSLESVTVRHKTGGISRIGFKSYDQGRIRWQGSTLDFIWCDEEPPDDIYSEALVRTQVKKGFIIMTFTPLLGMSKVVERFLKEKPEGSIVIKMGINDALHYTDEERRVIIASYPESERKARAEGDPVLGSGKVFPIDFANLIEQPIQIPDYWPRICGLDIGWDHPTAAVWLAWDRDLDIVHVYDEYRLKEQTPVVHSAAIKARGPWIPVAWPHDGMQHDSGSGKIIASQYRAQGVLMLPNHATHKPELGKKDGTGGYGLEAGIMDMLQRMQTGRWRVFSTCGAWKEEYELYYRKDGLIVKKGDDIMSASRVANMMLRFAKVRVVKQTNPNIPAFMPFDSGMGI